MLYNKYRPEDFDEFIGNEQEINKLKSVLDRNNENRVRTFLFTGPSGTGKTSVARIIKKYVNCGDRDFYEINAANTNGVDTAREILKTCSFKPSSGNSKIFLIDEAHMGTTAFWNCLLKDSEEPPDYAYFIFCTTEPQKILKTIKTRSSIFQFNLLKNEEINELLQWVCDSEQVDISNEVFDEIIRVSEGCPRESLTRLDQIIDLPSEEMLVAAKDFISDEKQIKELCLAITNQNWKKNVAIYKEIKEEPERIRRAILGYLNSCLLRSGDYKFADMILIFSSDHVYHSGKPALTRMIFDSTMVK